MGRLKDAITLTERARKMDPLNPSRHFNLGLYLHKLGRLQDAEAEFERALELSPNFPLNRHYAKNFLLQGRLQEALSRYQEVTVEGERLLGLALVHHALGNDSASAEAEQGLVDLEGNQAAWKLAQLNAYRGDEDLAFEWLEKAFELRDPVMGLRIKTEPLLRGLHDDPRWLDLVGKMGYP